MSTLKAYKLFCQVRKITRANVRISKTALLLLSRNIRSPVPSFLIGLVAVAIEKAGEDDSFILCSHHLFQALESITN